MQIQTERTQNSPVAIVGLGLVGTSMAMLALRAGYKVVGYDINQQCVQDAKSIQVEKRFLDSSDDSMALNGCRIMVIAIRPDSSRGGLIECVRDIEKLDNPPEVIIITSTVKPGATRELWQSLPSALRSTVTVVCCPERLREGDAINQILATPRLLGGLESGKEEVVAYEFLCSLGLQIERVSSAEVAELSKLVENAFLSVGISFISEVMKIAHALGLETHEVASAAATKPNGYFPFFPGAGAGGHCLPADLTAIRELAGSLDVSTPVLEGANRTMEEINSVVIAHLRRHAEIGPGAMVVLIGVGFKPGSSDLAGTPALEIVTLLREIGCDVRFVDSEVLRLEVGGSEVQRVPLEFCSQADAVLLLAGDASVTTSQICDRCDTVVDAGGGKIMAPDPRVIRL